MACAGQLKNYSYDYNRPLFCGTTLATRNYMTQQNARQHIANLQSCFKPSKYFPLIFHIIARTLSIFI